MHHDDADTAVLIAAPDSELLDHERPKLPGKAMTGELSEVEKALAVLAVLEGNWQGE